MSEMCVMCQMDQDHNCRSPLDCRGQIKLRSDLSQGERNISERDAIADALAKLIKSLESRLAASRKREEILRNALKILYEETADYIRINHLGDVHHNQSMKLAKESLGEEKSI